MVRVRIRRGRSCSEDMKCNEITDFLEKLIRQRKLDEQLLRKCLEIYCRKCLPVSIELQNGDGGTSLGDCWRSVESNPFPWHYTIVYLLCILEDDNCKRRIEL